ncbi:MAG: biliverdin-producing heme oxygenase [Pseudomonadota bacterium]
MIEDNTRFSVPEFPTSPPTSVASQASQPDPVQALRRATRDLHESLDQHLPLARADAGLADYATHLCVLRDWQAAIRPWLLRAGQTDPNLDLIADDLADCAGTGFPQPASPDTTALQNADDGSEAFCWGIAYVLEGSRLGGEVLYRRLQPRLAPHPLRYLGQRGAGGQPWPQFLATLRQKLAGDQASQAGCKGAVAAFQTLQAHFTQQGALA